MSQQVSETRRRCSSTIAKTIGYYSGCGAFVAYLEFIALGEWVDELVGPRSKQLPPDSQAYDDGGSPAVGDAKQSPAQPQAYCCKPQVARGLRPKSR